MADFLIEIGTEEVPAMVLNTLRRDFDGGVFAFLQRFGLLEDEPDVAQAKVFSTPRRLAVVVNGVRDRQPDRVEQVMGPAKKVAFKDGQPTAAAHAFAKKVGLDVSRVTIVQTAKGEYLTASVEEKGRSAQDLISNELPWVITGWPFWPQTMQWLGGSQAQRFIRPIRWIVALLDNKIIPLEFAGIKAGNQSRGHRILGPAQVSISLPSEYVETMQSASVLASITDREYKIRKALDAATRIVRDAHWREDPELLNTVVNLTEWPSAILGNFDSEFLVLPEEVLVTVMRYHQKYFAVEDAEHKLLPHFLAVLNTDNDPDGLIRHGNERVLNARFRDAAFFRNFDQRHQLAARVEMLKQVTFQKDLGSYYTKTERVAVFVQKIAETLSHAGFRIDSRGAVEAARLAKADLTTELVKEFTELQGIIGGRYAEYEGMPQRVADAIYDQYKPTSMEDSAPRTLEGAVLSIADKADSIAGMFALGLVPSGSKDPFALRRQANGIVKTIVEHKLPLNLAQIMADARSGYLGSEAEKKFTLSGEAYIDAVRGFFRERLEFYLRDVLGLAYDVVNATLAAGADDVVDAVARAEAVAKVRPSSDFESISVAFKRMKNILRQAAETKKLVAAPFNPSALKDAEEKKLAEAVPGVAKKVKELSASRQYESALHEISRLRPPIDAFFDKVMVMVEDENLRAQRLGLLQTLVNEFSSIADFSEIVTAG
jgi:glycyl-tRNA synthetase beta chain